MIHITEVSIRQKHEDAKILSPNKHRIGVCWYTYSKLKRNTRWQ